MRCFELGRVKEIVGVDIGSWDCGVKNLEFVEGVVYLKDILFLGIGYVGE